jgi:hypothetical protein
MRFLVFFALSHSCCKKVLQILLPPPSAVIECQRKYYLNQIDTSAKHVAMSTFLWPVLEIRCHRRLLSCVKKHLTLAPSFKRIVRRRLLINFRNSHHNFNERILLEIEVEIFRRMLKEQVKYTSLQRILLQLLRL